MKESEPNDNQEVSKQMIPKAKSSELGANFLAVLNGPGVAPAYTQETMGQHKIWTEMCNVAMALQSGQMGFYQNEKPKVTDKKPGHKRVDNKKKTTKTRQGQKADKKEKK